MNIETIEQLRRRGDLSLCPVAFIINNRQILIGLRNYTKDKFKDISLWTVPGGRSDESEDIETTLRREVEEEIGINDLIIHEYLGEVPGAKDGDLVLIFLCSMESDPRLMEPEKFSEWRWQNPDDMPENFINFAALNLLKNKISKWYEK